MGLRYRKSFKLPGGLRINLSKKGIGWSWGFKGFRHTHKASGGAKETFSIPHTGISYVKETGGSLFGKQAQSSPGKKTKVALAVAFFAGIVVGYALHG